MPKPVDELKPCPISEQHAIILLGITVKCLICGLTAQKHIWDKLPRNEKRLDEGKLLSIFRELPASSFLWNITPSGVPNYEDVERLIKLFIKAICEHEEELR